MRGADFFKQLGLQTPAEYKHRQMYGADYRGTKKQEIKPKEIFLELVAKHNSFENLKGYSIPSLSTTMEATCEWTYTRTENKHHESEFWLYTPPGRRKAVGIIQFPTGTRNGEDYYCGQWIKTIWIDPKYRGKGYSRKCFNDIIELVLDVNRIIKERKGYKKKDIDGNYFFVWLVPNPFYAPQWKIDQKQCDIDWSNPWKATKHIEDETEEDLSSEKKDISWTALRDFYQRIGFVIDETIHQITQYSWGEFDAVRYNKLTSRSIRMGRYTMRYPAEDAD